MTIMGMILVNQTSMKGNIWQHQALSCKSQTKLKLMSQFYIRQIVFLDHANNRDKRQTNVDFNIFLTISAKSLMQLMPTAARWRRKR